MLSDPRDADTFARSRSIVLLMKVLAARPSAEQVAEYCDRFAEILGAGGHPLRVRVYTVARRPAEGYATPLDLAEVDAIVAAIARVSA